MFKKSLVWILMLAMLLCTAVLGVSASEVSNGSSEQQVGTTVSAPDEASGSVKSSQKNVAKVGNTEYATIDEAIASWTNGTTLTLLADVTLSDVIKLSSTEHHILDLGTYTMTAASKKDAIQIVNNGRSSASYTLDVKADATNPGGITATGKTVVVTTGKSGVKDRPIIRFYNGVFNGSYIVKHSGSNGTNCPQFQYYGGVFNGTISTNRALNQFYGGTFTGSMSMSVDSSAYTLVAGGTFKYLSNTMRSELNSNKFTIGSAKGANNGSVCIDENGNYVITVGAPTDAEASVASNYNSSNYFYYSTVNTDGMYYEDVYDALNANKSATVTVFVEELDLAGSAFVGTIVVPEGNDLTITNAPADVTVKRKDGTVLNRGEDGTITTIVPVEVATYDELVAALANGGNIKLTADITVDTKITAIDDTVIDLNGKTLFVNVENSYFNNVVIKNGNIVLGKDDVHVCDGYFLVNAGKTLVLNGVKVSSSAEGIKGYAVFHLKTGANLDLINSELNIVDNEYSAGYIVYAGESTATVDVVGTTVTGSKVNGIVHAATVIEDSTFTITDATEHGINRSGVTITNSEVTISGGTGRGITAQHGPLVIDGDSTVTIYGMGEATIELRNNQNLTISETATVKLDAAVNNTTSGTVTGNVTVDTTLGAVAVIGNQGYKTLQAAIDAAQDGAVIEILEGFSGVAIKVEGKSVTIKGAVTLNNVSITGSTGIELTVEGLSFTGNSWIDSCGAAKLTVKNVTANVAPSNSTATNSRSAFISLGRTESDELDLTIESCNIVITTNGPDAVLGWAKVNEVAIKGSTFGSENHYFNNADAIKFMGIADGAVFTIEGNTVYSNYNGIVFGQNTTRGNAYTVNVKDNTFIGVADHIWVEVSGANTCHASINASSGNTVNNNAFTAKDIKLHPNLNSFTGYLGVDVKFDAEDKIISGSFIKAPAADLLADSYEANKGADGTYSIIKCLVGSGTEANPYLINNIADLILFRDSVNAGETKYNANGVYVKLAADIDLENAEWAPIGTKANPFKGTFDGMGYTVKNLTITGTSDYVGLFGVINTPAVVKNVTVKNVSITGSSYVGGIVGMAYTGTIEGCSVEGKINIQGHYMVGGITGHGYARIYDCSVIGDEGTANYITATWKEANLEGDNVGGIVGHNAETNVISGCTVKNVTISGTRKVGGIVGITAQNGTITGCTVSGITVQTTATAEYADENAKTMSIGGLIGQFQAAGSNNGKVSDCVIENVAFNNVNNVTVSIGAVTGGLRGSSNSTVKPADTIIMEDIEIDAASMTGTNNLFLTSYVAKIGEDRYFTSLSAAFAAVTSDSETVVILTDVTENLVGSYLRGNITTPNGVNVTITLTNTGWVYLPYTFVIGESVTLKIPNGGLFYYAGGSVINGTVITDAYYQRYAGTKLTINEPGSMTVLSETFILRYTDGDADAGIYINGDNNPSTIGLNASVIYFYQGKISATNANIKVGTYWQTNETDSQGSANLVLDNSTMLVTVSDHNMKATGNSTVALTNGSNIDVARGYEGVAVSMDATSSMTKNNGASLFAAKVGDKFYTTVAAAIAAAQAGDEIVILVAGQYSVPTGKNLTITGAVAGVEFTNIGMPAIGASMTFNNVTFTYAMTNAYNGLQHCSDMVYNNCTFNGQVFLYGTSETFNNCTFNQTDANNYNVWTYAAQVVAFNGCTFNSAGRSVLVYNDGATYVTKVNVTNTTFNASAPADGKAAIEMDSSLTAGIELTVDADTTANGFGTGNVSGNSLWNNKKGNNTDANNDITVVVAGETVLAPVTFVAKIGDISYASLEEAFKAATNGCTIEILADITIDGKWDCRDYATGGSHSQFKESVTINGNGHTLKFTGTINDSNWFTIFRFEENATVNNLTIDISEATGAQRVISAKKSLTVDGLTIIGAAKYGVIFGEGATADDLAATEIVIKNSTLTGTRRAISDNEGGKDVKSIVVTDNTLKANVYLSASESVKFSNNVANGEVDVRSYTSNTLSVEALGNTLTSGVKNFISAKTLNVQEGFAKQYKVSTKAELNAALAAAKDGDAIVLVADIDYGTDQLAITKAITFDLGGKTLTTRNAYGGMSVKGNPTIKNGTIVHASNTAAIKVWNAVAFENLIIDVQGKGDANKTIGGIVLQSGSTTRVGSIKNVTIEGAALTNGIETYNCGDATENVIGSMTNVTIDAVGTGLLISAPCGTATNCQISGGTNGIEIWIKGNYSASLELVDSSVEGGVYAHDEFNNNPGVVNDGKLSFVVDQDTVVDDITLTLARAENVEGELKEIKDNAEAKVNNTYYATIAAAINAAQDGDTVTIAAGEFGAINISNKNITVQGTVGANGELLTTIKGGNPAIVGHRFNGTIQNIKIVDAFKVMYAEPAGNVTVDNVYVTGATYGFHLIAYSTNLTWKIQNSYMDLSWANSFGVYGGDAEIIVTGNVFESTNPYYPDYGALPVNTFLPNVTVKDNFFGENTKIFVDPSVTDTSKIVIAENYHADGLSEALASDGQVVFIPSYYTDEAMQNLVTIVAKVGDTFYGSFADALAAAKAGDEVTLYADVALSADVTLPAGIILNGNGKSITGATVWAGGNLTFKGYTKMATFNAGYDKPVITIGEGATLEMTTGRMVIGHGATFNIVGTITDAKTANVTDLVPSLIIPGASFTGVGVNFNVTNAYVKFTAYCSSKNSNANGTFNINVENSIWEQTGSLVFSEPTSGKDPTFNFTLKDSVLNSTSHLVFGVTKGEIVFDNSNVNVGAYRQLENRSTLTIKNGSVVYAAHATSSNAKNPGTTIVENATYMATGEFTGSDVGIGTLILKKGANVTMGKITKANIVVDATGMTAGEIGLTANLSALAGTVSTINSNVLEAMIVDGKLVLAERTLLGSGTEADPYLIYNIADLLLFRDSVNAGETKYNAPGVWVALAADIDLAGAAAWTVGIGDGHNYSFDGCFDGKGHTIKNLVMNPYADSENPETAYICGGLFGYTYGAVTIKNLVLENVTVETEAAGHNVGALVGFANNNGGKLNIFNVTVKNATIDAPNANGVGAIVGYSYRAMGTIENCTVDGATITGDRFVGGITGYSYDYAIISGCTVKNATITGNKGVGGIAGLANGTNQVSGNTVEGVIVTANTTNVGYVVGEIGSEGIVVENNIAAEPQVGGSYSTGKPVQAKIGNKYYTTLAKALETAQAGDTIVLLTSVVVNADETLELNKAVTITYTSNVPGEDMITNRGTLIVDGATLVYVNTDTTASNVTVSTISSEAGSVLEIKSGEVRNDSANNGAAGIYAFAIDLLTNGTLGDVTATISGGKVISTNYMAIRQFNNGTACKNTLTVEGGYIYGAKRAIQIHMDNNAGILAIKGGKIEAGTYALCLFPTTSTNIAITGGTFVGTVYSGTNGIISGGTFDKAVEEAYCAEGYIPTKNADGTFGVKEGVFTVRNTTTGVGYETLAEAVAAAQEGDTVVVLAGTHSEGTVKLPATLVNVTIKGEAGAILKDTTISATDGNSYKYVGLTFDGLTFDNSRILFTGWRNGEEIIKDLTVTNCIFKNLNDNTNTAPVHINKDASEAVNGFVFTNNVIDGATGGSKSGVYLQATGNVVFENNVINNVSFRPYVVQLTTDDGIADTFTVKGNTFSGSAVGRAQGLASNAAGTDAVTLVVTGNIFKDITNAQQICYWNFNAETTTADMSGNYYDIDILNNPSKIYFNQAATNANDLINMGVYPYYADEAMTQKVEAPAIMVIYPDGKIEYYENMIKAVPYTTNCPRLEGATIVLLKDVQASGMRFMENDMVFDLNGHTFTITAGTGSQGTNTSGFQIRPEVTTDVIFKNGTINVAAGAPVVWMFNCYATSFVVENVTVDCTNMAWSYGSSCYVAVNREGDNVVFVNTVIENFNSAVAGCAYSIGGTMEVGENVILGGTVELGAGATLTAPAGVDVVAPEGYKVVYANGVYSLVKCQAKIGNVYYATFAEAVAAAQAGDEIKILVAGQYSVPTGKNLTITGAVVGVEFSNIGEHGMAGASVTFNNVTFNYAANSTYKGLQHSGDLVYNNCTFNGQVFLYGTSETFNNCTFNQTDADNYNVWTYSADEVTFNKCTFNSAGKSVLIYAESATEYNEVNVIESTFVARSAVEGKAAIEMDSSLTAGIELTVDAATTVSGFGTGNVSGNSLWNNKKGNNTDANNDITVVVAGETVLAPVTFVAKIGNIGYTSFQAAMNAAVAGDTVELFADVKLTGKYTITKAVTIDGNGHSIIADETAVWYTVSGKLNIKNYKTHLIGINSDGVTLKDVVLDCNNNAAGINVYVAQNVVFDNVSIINATKGTAALTVNGSTVTFKTAFAALGNGTALDISQGSGVTSPLGVTVEDGTLFNLADKVVKFADGATVDVEGAVDANNEKYFASRDNAYFYTEAQMNSRTSAYSNGLTLLKDVTMTRDLSFKGTLDLNGYSITFADGKGVVSGQTGYVPVYENGKYVIVKALAKLGEVYYATFEEAIAAAQAGDEITLLADIEASEVIIIGKSLTINGNGHKITSTATRVIRVTASNVGVTLNDVNMVSRTVMTYPNDIRGISVDPALANVKLTLNNCSVDFTDASACDWAYAVNVSGNGTGHTLTVNGGSYEGANVINVHGANNTVTVEGATLTSLYPNSDEYYGAGIWVLQNQGSSVVAKDNVFNGSNAIAFNLGTGTALTESNNTDNMTKVVAKIDTTYYTSLEDAFKAATAGCEIKILHNVVIDYYWDARYTGAKFTVPVTINGNGKTLKFTNTVYDGGNYMSAFRFEADATVKNLTVDMSEALSGFAGRFRAISAKADLTVDNSTFIGNGSANNTRAIIFGEGAGTAIGEVDVTITNSTFTGWKRAISDNENAQDAKTVTIMGNTMTDASVNVSASESVVFTGNTVENATVTISSYAQTNELSVVAKDNDLEAGNHSIAAKEIEAQAEFMTPVAQIGGKLYLSIQSAIKAAAAGDTVKLLANVELTKGLTVAADKEIVLDLAGKTISMTDASSATAALITNNGTLTINDSVGGGKITFNSTTPSANNGYASNVISNHGTIAVLGGTIENTTVGGACYALDNYAGSTATIAGGKLIAEKTAVRIFNWTNGEEAKATLNVTGGEIVSKDGYGINVNCGNAPYVALNISGGTITTNDTDYNLAVYVVNKGSAENLTVAISDGTFNGYFALNGVTSTTMAQGAVSVTNGTFEGIICYDTPAYGFVSGGKFIEAVEEAYCAEGYIPTENADGTFGVKIGKYVARNATTGVGYESFAEAIAAAQDGDIIKLVADQVYNGYMIVDGITLDLNGCDLTVNGALIALKGASLIDSAVEKGKLKVVSENSLVLSDVEYPMLPIWVGDGYVFAEASVATKPATTTQNGFEIRFRPILLAGANNAENKDANQKFIEAIMADGIADNGLTIEVFVHCMRGNVEVEELHFVIDDENVDYVYDSTSRSFTLTLKGATAEFADEYVVTVAVKSNRNVTFATEIYTFIPTTSSEEQ